MTNQATMTRHAGAVRLHTLRCEDQMNPLGLDIRQPKLSWQLSSERRGVWQTAYQIVVAADENFADILWDTGKTMSDESAGVLYTGPALVSRRRYFWRVRIWDEAGAPTAWSPAAWWEMALLEKSDWQAQWIEPVQEPTVAEPMIPMFQNMSTISPEPDRDYSLLQPPQFLRRAFAATGTIQQARIYATAHGVYQLSLNGQRVGDQELAPEPTAYDKYLQYQTYDVTDLLRAGDNVLGAVLADGWYIGRIGLPGANCQYGDRLALLLQLEITYADGRRQTIVSDCSFKSSTGPLLYSDLFIGERYDARLELPGWDQPGFDDAGWQGAIVAAYGYETLVAHYGEPLRVVQAIPARAIWQTPAGDTVVDLGQNISGKLRMAVAAPAGTEIRLDFSEALDADGNFLHQLRGRNKDQQDFYVSSGRGRETYTAWFTTHGFRYVRLVGYPGTPRPADFIGLVIASDLHDSGSFSCSDERLNQLQQNICWSQRGNLVAIPTDCPQRERAGFTGDAQIFAATASFNMAVLPFFRRWLRNVALEQQPDGQVPNIVPYWRGNIEMIYPLHNTHTSAGWGDACIIVPWELYQAYGDEQILAENYEMMVRWLDYIQAEAESGLPERLKDAELDAAGRERQRYLWNTGFHFGDWLIPSLVAGGQNAIVAAAATAELVACSFYAYSTQLLAKVAEALGKEADVQLYTALNARIRDAFAAEYVGPDGRLPAHYQGLYVLALHMNMVPATQRPLLLKQLVDLIVENGYRLDTGFVSVPYLLDVLHDNGRADVALKVLFQTECPSWLYEVERGATTIWERWDAIQPDGQVGLTSFNHYAFGCVGDWLYRVIAGLGKAAPGYRRILIQPEPPAKLSGARASYQSVYGEIISAWQRQNGQMQLTATIPPNTSATIRLPGANLADLQAEPGMWQDGPDVVVAVESGSYQFTYPLATA